MKARRVAFPVFLASVLLAMSWLMLTNYQRVDELQRAGKNPVTIATPGTNGRDGLNGKSAYQVWLDAGHVGTERDFLNSLRGEDGRDGQDGQSIKGDPGRDGQPGAAGRNGIDGQSVVGAQGAQGVAGPRGEAGATGAAGADGRTPTISCVTRTVNNQAVNFVAWKYTEEADGAYRNLYRLPSWAQTENCVNV